MQITGFAFHIFYQKLAQKLLEKCFSLEQRLKVYPNSPGFWITKSLGHGKGKQLFLIAYGEKANSKNPRYLYDKTSDYKIGQSKLGMIEDLIMIACLEFMGYNLPKKIKNPSFFEHEPVIALVLFQLFAESEMTDYERNYLEEFRVFDHDNNCVIESFFIKKRGLLKAVEQNSTGDIMFEITTDELWRFQTHRKLSTFIEQYFSLLNAHNFKDAMNLWSSDARYELWQDQLKEFQRLYWNLTNISVKSIHLEESNANASIFKFYMIYEQNVNVKYDPDIFDFLSRTPLEQTKEITAKINKFLARSERNNFGISKMGLHNLFDFSAIEKLHVLGAYDQTRLEEVLPFDKKMRLIRFATCEVEETVSEKLVFNMFINERHHY